MMETGQERRSGDTVEHGPRRTVLYETARALTESRTFADAMTRVLRAICESLNWPFGAYWEVDRSRDLLQPVGSWHAPDSALAEFAAITKHSVFTRGVGLPGRVWVSGEPVWIPDVTRDENFPRAS